MGEQPENVFSVGSPAIDAVAGIDFRKQPLVFPELDINKPYLLVLVHPVATNSKEENIKMAANLISVIKKLPVPKIILGSNIDAGSDVLGGVIKSWLDDEKPNDVFFTKHLHPDDFYKYLKYTTCAVGNSSSFIREGAFLGTPVVLLGSRQKNRERAENVLEYDGTDVEEIKEAILSQCKKGHYDRSSSFGDGRTGQKIADLLADIAPDIQKCFHDITTN